MGYRVAFSDSAMVLVWVFTGFLELEISGFSVLLISLGFVTAIVYGVFMTMRQLERI